MKITERERIVIDFPGSVYGIEPRILFKDEDGNVSKGREATAEEVLLWWILQAVDKAQ